MKELSIPLLTEQDIDCRVQSVSKAKTGRVGAVLLLYKDARVDMRILDQVFGPGNWQRTHEVINGNLFCTGIYGTVRVPAAKIDTSALTLDVAHINERRHGVTQEEAVSYIKNAAFSLKRRHWTGETFLNYYSEEGASYVRTSDNVIRTSFKKDEFDKKTKSAMEVLKNGE